MRRKKWFQLLFILAGLLLGMTAWILWARQLGPAEAAVVGTWTSSRQPDGSTMLMHLRYDHGCRLRWLDDAGKDTAHSPRDGQWWVEGKTLFVDMSLERGFPWFLFERSKKSGDGVWDFAVQNEKLVLGIKIHGPATLHRSPAGAP